MQIFSSKANMSEKNKQSKAKRKEKNRKEMRERMQTEISIKFL